MGNAKSSAVSRLALVSLAICVVLTAIASASGQADGTHHDDHELVRMPANISTQHVHRMLPPKEKKKSAKQIKEELEIRARLAHLKLPELETTLAELYPEVPKEGTKFYCHRPCDYKDCGTKKHSVAVQKAGPLMVLLTTQQDFLQSLQQVRDTIRADAQGETSKGKDCYATIGWKLFVQRATRTFHFDLQNDMYIEVEGVDDVSYSGVTVDWTRESIDDVLDWTDLKARDAHEYGSIVHPDLNILYSVSEAIRFDWARNRISTILAQAPTAAGVGFELPEALYKNWNAGTAKELGAAESNSRTFLDADTKWINAAKFATPPPSQYPDNFFDVIVNGAAAN